ncbi:unnamed protein product [Prorocentrum cordatum]|uniref:Uncharacterized protein n=1 Tax=Prorocentrum cordatum TaxID=2364126 RepID=A0ABN9SND3_9DINO|nr:unnamed protein product [Polarella glacialis]
MWLHQYDFRTFWDKGCVSHELADVWSRTRKVAADAIQTVVFQNNLQKPVHVYYAPWRLPEEYSGEAPPGGSLKVDAADGEVLHVYSKRSGGKLVAKRMVTGSSVQRVNLGKRRGAEL